MKTYYIILCALLMACSESKKITAPTPKSIALDALVNNNAYEIISDQAMPTVTAGLAAVSNSGILGVGNTASNINLVGNSNYLRVEGDTISGDLPYFGERQMGGGYTSDAGIKFKGIPEKYSHTKDETTKRHEIKFQISGEQTENFMIYIILFPNWTSTIQVNSNQRNSIRYNGVVVALEEKE